MSPRVFNFAHGCANKVKFARKQLIIVLKLNHFSAYFSPSVDCVSETCELPTYWSTVDQQFTDSQLTVSLGELFFTFTQLSDKEDKGE